MKKLSILLSAAALVLAAPLVVVTVAGAQGESSQTIYTCGMHPNVVQHEPGTCPICGMNLTPQRIASPSPGGPKGERKIKHWVAPMNPEFISDKPGKSPMGMDLVPVYEDDGNLGGGSQIRIDPTVVQNMGVRTKLVERGPVFRHIRTIGIVDVAENSLSVVNLRFSGWIERIHVDETGVLVKRGQSLFEIYSPELVSAQDEYLLALRTAGPDSPLVRSARTRLEHWNLSAGQIARIAKNGKALRTISVRAPQTGYVLHKSVVQGARVQSGVDLYRIGNLSKIWVNAEVYEFDAPWVQLGQPARMELSFQRGKLYEGTVAHIYPTLNARSRTLRVRLEFDNPGLALKPGMFATVQIEAQRRDDVLIIPTESIIHSGVRQIVFVTKELGLFEMREIITGITGDRHVTEVLSGVALGERVVTSGQFLLDSESQLQEAVQKLLAARAEAAAKSGPQEAGPDPHSSSSHEAEVYWTCGMHPQIVQDEPGTCPICGMNLVEKRR